MIDFTREYSLEECKSYIHTLTCNIKGMSDGRAADAILASLNKVNGDKIEDSPLYRVGAFLISHSLFVAGCESYSHLIKKIASDTMVKPDSVRSILAKYAWKLPPNLKSRTYIQKNKVSANGFCSCGKVHYGAPCPESKVQTLIVPPVSISKLASINREVRNIELGVGVGEVIIKCGNVEITIKFKEAKND